MDHYLRPVEGLVQPDARMIPAQRLPRRLDANDDDLKNACDVAHAIAVATLGRDPGPLTTAESMSHYVYLGSDIVVKLVDAAGHKRLDREITLAPLLPTGLGAPLLGSGRYQRRTYDVRYACFARMPGTPPGIDLPGVDAVTARRLAEDAVQRLNRLHSWQPAAAADRTLRDSLHQGGGFVSQAALMTGIENLAAADRARLLPRHLLEGLTAIAEGAPMHARADVPVHADCDWGNWLARDHRITALVDFERAHLGEPADDWFLLAVTSGAHQEVVLDVIADTTTTSLEALRAECEVRDAAFIAEDLREAFDQLHPPAWLDKRVRDLEELVVGRRWWSHAR